MKKGFTLIEIIVAVMIISVAGFSLIQMQSNSRKSLELIENRLNVNKFSSFLFSNISKDLHRKKRTVYEFIQNRYKLDDDDLIEYLKTTEYEYSQTELFFLSFGENEEEQEDSSFEMVSVQKKEENEQARGMGFLVEKVSISDEQNNSTFLYHFSFSK